MIDRLGGPAVSIIIHGIVIAVLINVVMFQTMDTGREVEVQVIEPADVPEPNPERPAPEELPPDESLALIDDPVALPETPMEEPVAEAPDLSGLSVQAADSPLVMKGLFAGRSAGARADRLKKFGGGYGDQIEAAVMRALRWLAAQQNPSGYWGSVSRYNQSWHDRRWTASLENEQRTTRLTALCLLAFLAHGETPQSAEFGETVRLAVEYLKAQQNPETGLFVPVAESRPEKGGEDLAVYAHAQAAYALAEAYALTRAPALRRSVELGLQVIIDGQLENGAWGNWYQQNIADSSATSWQIQALKAAEAAGIRLNGLNEAMEKAALGTAYLYQGDGEWLYRKGPAIKTWKSGGPVISGAMVLSLQLLGRSDDSMVSDGLRYLNDFGVTDWEPAWADPINKSLPATYEWYYNTQAVFQRGGSRWKRWNADFAPMLLKHQHEDGWWRGPGQQPGEETVYSTSLCALALQVYYRILPTFQQKETSGPTVKFEDDVIIRIL